MENKFETTYLLLKLLQSTRQFVDLRDLIYMIHENNDETIKAVFENGHTKDINVSGDSGIALIKDVIKGLV